LLRRTNAPIALQCGKHHFLRVPLANPHELGTCSKQREPLAADALQSVGASELRGERLGLILVDKDQDLPGNWAREVLLRIGALHAVSKRRLQHGATRRGDGHRMSLASGMFSVRLAP
jgi:hypothetical protein